MSGYCLTLITPRHDYFDHPIFMGWLAPRIGIFTPGDMTAGWAAWFYSRLEFVCSRSNFGRLGLAMLSGKALGRQNSVETALGVLKTGSFSRGNSTNSPCHQNRPQPRIFASQLFGMSASGFTSSTSTGPDPVKACLYAATATSHQAACWQVVPARLYSSLEFVCSISNFGRFGLAMLDGKYQGGRIAFEFD